MFFKGLSDWLEEFFLKIGIVIPFVIMYWKDDAVYDQRLIPSQGDLSLRWRMINCMEGVSFQFSLC